MLQIFIINGPVQSGKTTFGQMVGTILERENIPFEHNSSVGPVKNYLKEFGWNGELWDGVTKDDYWKRIMYECKCWMIEKDEHIFDKFAVGRLLDISDGGLDGVFFFDIREPENIQQIVDYVNENNPEISIKTVFVNRSQDLEFNNYADRNQGNYTYDIFLDNNGTLEDLEKISIDFVSENIKVNKENLELERKCK